MIKFLLDYSSGMPIYRQIIDQIRFGIASGQLKLGEQLPTVRALAVELKVNLNTVSKAYKELEIKNILETQQGTGTFISKTDHVVLEKEREDKLKEICTQFSSVVLSYGFSLNEVIRELKDIETSKKQMNMTTNVINKGWFNPISLSVLLILVIVSAVLYVSKIINIPIFILLLLLSGLVTSAIRIADQWERAVVLRMGKYNGLKGPGPFMIIPVIDSVSTYIDQRVRVSAFKAEQTLTKDTVPVNVDAVVYWTVWDVEKAALEVQEYQKAIEHITQTGLRDTIGKHELSDLLQERDKIAEDLQQVLDRNTNPWGITCQTVGIKDIAIPQDLAEAMSKEAQAERERRARVILGTAETEIAEKFEQASKKYTDNPVALHLRGMNMLFEGLKEKGSMVIVPSSALDTMNLGAMGGLVSLAKNNETPK